MTEIGLKWKCGCRSVGIVDRSPRKIESNEWERGKKVPYSGRISELLRCVKNHCKCLRLRANAILERKNIEDLVGMLWIYWFCVRAMSVLCVESNCSHRALLHIKIDLLHGWNNQRMCRKKNHLNVNKDAMESVCISAWDFRPKARNTRECQFDKALTRQRGTPSDKYSYI